MMSIINIFHNIYFDHYQVMDLLLTLGLVILIGLVIRKIIFAYKTERKIDEHLRETRARILRVVTEIEEAKDEISEVVSCMPEVSEIAPKGKKTRAMSMDERWADYEKKRTKRGTAITH